MNRVRKPSPAMVVAMVALIAALGGTAFAQQAVMSAKKKATKIIAKRSITGGLIKPSAIASSRIKNNSVTGTDVNEATLGKVPSAAAADTAAAATNATNAQNAVNATNATNAAKAATADKATVADGLSNQVNFSPKRVAATDGADFNAALAAAPKTALGTLGQFSYYAKCLSYGTTVEGYIFVESTVDRALMDSDYTDLDGGPAAADYLNIDSPELDRGLKSNSIGDNSADIYENHNNEFLVMAPNLDTYRGETFVGVKNGAIENNSAYGIGDACLFGGFVYKQG